MNTQNILAPKLKHETSSIFGMISCLDASFFTESESQDTFCQPSQKKQEKILFWYHGLQVVFLEKRLLLEFPEVLPSWATSPRSRQRNKTQEFDWEVLGNWRFVCLYDFLFWRSWAYGDRPLSLKVVSKKADKSYIWMVSAFLNGVSS